MLGQEAEVSVWQWGSRRRVAFHLALECSGRWVPSAHTMLGGGPYLNCLRDLLFGPLVLATHEDLHFLEAPISLEGPAYL